MSLGPRAPDGRPAQGSVPAPGIGRSVCWCCRSVCWRCRSA